MALDVDDPALVDEVVALQNTALAVDAPWVCEVTAESLVGWVRHGWDLEPGEHVVGLRGDRVVAVGAVYTSQWDNPDRAFLEALVHPDVRRQGAGSALLEHLTARARELGRCKLGAAAWDRSAGTPFLDRHGYAVGSRAIQRRQHVAEVPLDQVETLCRDASEAAAGYELLRWVGETPEALLDSVATMTSAINDAPLDDLDVEDEVYPPQRIRDYETATRLRGQRAYRLLARHRESGELAGRTTTRSLRSSPAATAAGTRRTGPRWTAPTTTVATRVRTHLLRVLGSHAVHVSWTNGRPWCHRGSVAATASDAFRRIAARSAHRQAPVARPPLSARRSMQARPRRCR